MKIALVCHNFTLNKGGLERDTVFLGRELVKRGHEVHIFSHRQEPEPGLVFHHVSMIRITSPGKNLSFAFAADRALSGFRFDIVQAMDRIRHSDIFRVSDGINPVQMLHKYPDPLIRKLNAAGPRRQVLSWLERQIFQRGGCRMVLAISDIIKQEIIRHYHVDSRRIAVIYSGVDTACFNPSVRAHGPAVREKYGIRPDDFLLLFISNDHRRKNLDGVLDALVRLNDRRFRLMVIGSDKTVSYERRIRRDGLEGRVIFAGAQKEIERFYGAGDIFVFPSNYDAFGNVCLEAMACGLPVIASRTCGASELIRDGENGFVVDAGDSMAMADRLTRLGNVDQREAMGKQAAETGREYTLERYMDQMIDLYEHVRQMPAI